MRWTALTLVLLLFGCAQTVTSQTTTDSTASKSAPEGEPRSYTITRPNPFYGGFYFQLPSDWVEMVMPTLAEGSRVFTRPVYMSRMKPPSIAVVPLPDTTMKISDKASCAQFGNEMALKLEVKKLEFRHFDSGDFCQVIYVSSGSSMRMVVLRAKEHQFTALLGAAANDDDAFATYDGLINSWGTVRK